MKLRIIITLILIFTLFIRVHGQEPRKWYTFKNDTIGFTINFPEEPKFLKKFYQNENLEFWMNMYHLDRSGDENSNNVFYAASYAEYDTTKFQNLNIKDYYTNAINGMIKNVQGKLLQEKTIDINGYSGREIRVDFRNGLAVITSRIVFVGPIYYNLMVITLANKDFNKDINKFFNSFDLLHK